MLQIRDLGFTGTREGPTNAQREIFTKFIASEISFERFHQGCCAGSDHWATTAIRMHRATNSRQIEIHSHRSNLPVREFWQPDDVVYEPLGPLTRNLMIIKASQLMIAISGSENEVLRSGTWHAIRHSRKQKVPVWLIYPSGRVVKDKYV